MKKKQRSEKYVLRSFVKTALSSCHIYSVECGDRAELVVCSIQEPTCGLQSPLALNWYVAVLWLLSHEVKKRCLMFLLYSPRDVGKTG